MYNNKKRGGLLRQIGEGGLAVISQYPPQPVKVPARQACPLTEIFHFRVQNILSSRSKKALTPSGINVLTILPCFLCLTNQLSKTGMETGDIS